MSALPLSSIIDAHAHLCDPQRFAYRWAARDPHDLRFVDGKAFFEAAQEAPVEALIFVEAVVASGEIEDELAFAHEEARRDPRIRAFIAASPFDGEKNVEAYLARLAEDPLARGIRILSRYAAKPDFFLQESVIRVIRALGTLQLVCETGVWARELCYVAELAKRCPSTQFALNHAGKPDIAEDGFASWSSDLAELGHCPNVACKISGLGTLAGKRGASLPVIAPYIARTFDIFGAERTLFGSDWPMMEAKLGYPEWVEIVRSSLPTRSPAELANVFRENALRIYRL